MGEKGLTGGLVDFARRQPGMVVLVLVLAVLYLSKSGAAGNDRAVIVAGVDLPAPTMVTYHRTTYAVGVDPRSPDAIQVLSTRDRRTWTVRPDALHAPPAWADPSEGLGPAAIGVFDGSFVLYYTATVRGLGIRCVSAATSKHLDEPFEDTSLAPFVCQTAEGGSTDPSPFVDAAGRPYLAWSSPGQSGGSGPALWAQPLRSDGLVLTGNPATLLRPSLPWQAGRVASPSILEDNGHYHLVYSAAPELNDRQVVANATCRTPLGPCEAAERPMLTGSLVGSGPGGAHVFADARHRWWLGLHTWDAPPTGAYAPLGRFVVVPLQVHDDSLKVAVTSTVEGTLRTSDRDDRDGRDGQNRPDDPGSTDGSKHHWFDFNRENRDDQTRNGQSRSDVGAHRGSDAQHRTSRDSD
ncbi:family 43 glycosylhydrolase [Frankia sp. R82]|uniref:family 43 glycosylhydrolase n=1 Tax=Frankia sp. R82 TaxID=2950553 RepID=UPI0020443768|nr:family 43 glycosylhydrolase [Frankia sp. R82]MCM3883652.1 family 43 glycosylhydrolase [Frankia sp. R82]